MIKCQQCEKNPASQAIGLCVDCLRSTPEVTGLSDLHVPFRKEFGLPLHPPNNPQGIACNFCSNNCQMGQGEMGYCGLRRNESGKLVNTAPRGSALGIHVFRSTAN